MLLLSRNKICYVIIKEHVCTCTYCKLEVHLKMLFKVDTFKEGLSNFFTNISYQLFWITKSCTSAKTTAKLDSGPLHLCPVKRSGSVIAPPLIYF